MDKGFVGFTPLDTKMNKADLEHYNKVCLLAFGCIGTDVKWHKATQVYKDVELRLTKE